MHDGVSTCWHWSGSANPKYGTFAWDARRPSGDKCKRMLAHRASYMLYVGEIPEGKELDHVCRNTLCVNPAHLRPCTRKENMEAVAWANRDKPKGHKRPLKLFCKRGHDLSINSKPTADGRECRICRVDIYKRQRLRRASAAGREIGVHTKVTDDDVALIRYLASIGARNIDLARGFDLSPAQTCRIVKGSRRT